MKEELVIRNLSAGYDKKVVVSDISFRAKKGEITVVLGPNGSGKSTLLKTIGRIIKPYSGEISLYGEDILALKQSQSAKRITYLSQSRGIPEIRVENLVLHGRFPYTGYPRRYKKEDYDKVNDALKKMGIYHKREELMSSLSGGERQKVYIAMCLVQETDVILFDEPTTFLDISRQYQVLSEARELADEGKCIIMVLHDIPVSLETADKIVLMDKGRIVMEGKSDEVFDSGILQTVFGVEVKKTVDHYYTKRAEQ